MSSPSAVAGRLILLMAVFAPGLHARRQGKLQCICTTADCYDDNVATCTADYMCYVQYMPRMRDEPEPETPLVTRGCINERTPLLCENRRPAAYDGAWPILYCCRDEWCNRDMVPTHTPVTPRPAVADQEKGSVRLNKEDAGTSSRRVVADNNDSDSVNSYDESVSSDNERTPANRGRHRRRSRLMNPLYIGVPIAGACVLLAMIIFAIYILRRNTPYTQRAYQYPTDIAQHKIMCQHRCPPPGGAKSAVARTQVYTGSDRSPCGSEVKLLMKV